MKLCDKCLCNISFKNIETIELIKDVYLNSEKPWYIGYSGGKDSSAVLKLIVTALSQLKEFHQPVTIVHCDTGVEIPTVTNYVRNILKKLRSECKKLSLPIKISISEPDLADRYFVRVIGRGYPTPTNKFRWCTKMLRVKPVEKVIGKKKNCLVVLGVRKGESVERDKTIKNHSTNNEFLYKQNGKSNIQIFSPIINYNINDVWSTINNLDLPKSVKFEKLNLLYKEAGAECPIIKDPKGSPCGKGRFGCWTCTVVRKDKAVTNLVKNGYPELEPLLNFRNWIAEFRDNMDYRCTTRRNGQLGNGPITLKGRQIILKELLKTQKKVKYNLISTDEIKAIKALWKKDEKNEKYMAIDHGQ